MTNEDMRKFEALNALKTACEANFDKRRSFEWKLSLSLWTAFAIFIMTLVQSDRLLFANIENAPAIVSVVSLGVFLLYFIWTIGLGRANNFDRKFAYDFYEKEIIKLLGIVIPADLAKDKTKIRSKMGKIINWSHAAQLGITALLAFTAIIAASMKS